MQRCHATMGDKLVLNWHGTPTQRDGVLQMFPVIRDKSMPGVELGGCADAVIASIHDDGMSPDETYVEAGGLMSYGVDYVAMHRRIAALVAKILEGTKPADIPVEQPTRFEFVVNLKTAKAIGIELPTSILVRADEVIE